jgi:hypothetical protein
MKKEDKEADALKEKLLMCVSRTICLLARPGKC